MNKQQEAEAATAIVGDSISSVGIAVKDYPPSEIYTNEPPPAYKQPRATAVQVARLAAFTVIACTTILGACIIASAWIQASASCSQLIHAETLLHQQQNDESVDRPSYQALVDPLQSEESSESKQESTAANNVAPQQSKEQTQHVQSPPSHSPPQPSFESQGTPIQIKLPLSLDLDDLAASLMEKNQRSRMNCVVEKKRAEEVMDHQPKTVRLPFGVNITTDPRYEHVSGERIAIYCESGHDTRNLPMDQMQPQPQQAAPMIVPVPMNMPLMMPAQHNQQPMHPHPNQIPLSMITRVSQQDEQQLQDIQKDDSPITIIAREEHVIPIFQQVVPEIRQAEEMRQAHEMRRAQEMRQAQEIRQAQEQRHAQEMRQAQEMRNLQEMRQHQQEMRQNAEIRHLVERIGMQQAAQPEQVRTDRMMYHPASPEGRMLHTIAVPEGRFIMESRNLPHPPAGPMSQASVPSELVRPPPPPAFQKIPIHVPTILQQVETEPQEQQQVTENAVDEDADSETRPHYVQPRSVRSVDAQLHPREKRTRRYACSCTC